MIQVIKDRLISAIPTLLLLATLAFFLIRFAPGGPFDFERALPAEIEANLNHQYHLDEPLPMQYLRYMGDLLTGDLGPSFQYRDYSVNDLIASGAPVSLLVGGLAMLLSTVLGIVIGIYAAAHRQSWRDHLLMTFTLFGISIPNFVMAPLLVLAFAIALGWLPAGGWNGGSPGNLVLPVITLALPQLAYVARMIRSNLLEAMRSDFVRTARAKGLSEQYILVHHALRPALLSVVSYLGPATAAVMTGSVVVEQIFGIPGLGRFFVQGALNRDYTLVMGVVIFYGVMVILLNLAVDVIYAMLDPRTRLK